MRPTKLFVLLAATSTGIAVANAQLPPPVITSPSLRDGATSEGQRRFPVQVDARAGGEVLYQGTLQLGSPVTSQFRQEIVEAGSNECGDGDAANGIFRGAGASGSRTTSFSISLVPGYQASGSNRIQVVARWVRPGPHGCAFEPSSRTIELKDAAILPAGGQATLTGDGGLVIRLIRR